MKSLWVSLSLALIPLVLLAEASDPYALPDSGRPRFRHHTQRPVRMDDVPLPSDSMESTESDPERPLREAWSGFRLQEDGPYGFGVISEIPMLTPEIPEEGEEAPESSGLVLDPLDFLTDEDLLMKDADLQDALGQASEESGEDVMDWASLSDTLQQELLLEEESDDEDMESQVSDESLARDLESEVQETGLNLTHALEGSEGADAPMAGLQTNPDGPGIEGRSTTGMAQAYVLEPLQAVRPSEFSSARTTPAESRPALSESRKLFDEIRGRWQPSSASPSVSAFGRDVTETTGEVASPSFQPVAVADRSFPSASLPPASNLPSASSFPNLTQPVGMPAPDKGVDRRSVSGGTFRNRFNADNGRVRSLIGVRP